jgi:O-antigen/teichoic acid export membrane protein
MKIQNTLFFSEKQIFYLKIMSQGVRKGSIYALIGQGSAGVFLALFDVFAGRWLGVEQYGLLKILYDSVFFTTTVVIAGIVLNLSRNIAHFKAKNDKKGVDQTIQSSIVIFLITLILFIGLTLLFKNWVTNKFFNSENIMLLQFILGISFLAVYQFYNGIFQGYRRFHIFSFGIGTKEFLTLVFLFLIIKVWSKSVTEAGWSIVLSPIPVIVAFTIILTIKNTDTNIKWKNIFRNLKNNSNFPNILRFILAIKMTSIMNQCVLRAGPIILKAVVMDNPDYYAGIFSAITMPLKLIRTLLITLTIGLLPNLTRAYSEKNEDRVKRYIYKSLGLFIFIDIAITAIYFFFGPQIIQLIYREEFLVYRSQTTLLAFAMSFFFLSALMATIMIARGTPKVPATSLFIGLVFMTLAIIFLKNTLSPINLVGTALLICNFIYFFLQSIYFLSLRIKKKTN